MAGIIHIILFLLEDLWLYIAGIKGINFWFAFSISAIIFYFYYSQIVVIIKKLLSFIGIRL